MKFVIHSGESQPSRTAAMQPQELHVNKARAKKRFRFPFHHNRWRRTRRVERKNLRRYQGKSEKLWKRLTAPLLTKEVSYREAPRIEDKTEPKFLFFEMSKNLKPSMSPRDKFWAANHCGRNDAAKIDAQSGRAQLSRPEQKKISRNC